MIDKKEVGKRIKNIRKAKGLNQSEFADLVNATVPAVSNWESGRNLPNNERLVTIADLVGISVDELTNGKPLVTVKKVKKGTPTVIEYEGRRYILEHKDQYRGK